MIEAENVKNTDSLSAKNPKESFSENGYFVWKKLIPESVVDGMIESFKTEILPSRRLFIRANGGRWLPNEVNAYGNMVKPLGDPHDLDPQFKFGAKIRDLLCGSEIHQALSTITEHPKFKFVQSMFYDCNTNSAGHTDDLYLDSVPNGNMVGMWIALEDIPAEAGRFYVVPKSNKINFNIDRSQVDPNSLYVKKISDFLDQNPEQMLAPALQKGDVVFWNSKTVHGSFPTTDPKLSRKSLTAHFIPSTLILGNIYRTFDQSHIIFSEHLGVDMRVKIHNCSYLQDETFESLQQSMQKYIDENNIVLRKHEEIFSNLQSEINRLNSGKLVNKVKKGIKKIIGRA